MTWFRDNLRVLIAVLIFSVGSLAGVRAEIMSRVDRKADLASVVREMDQIHAKLACIESKIDALLLQRAKRDPDQ